MRVKLKSFLMRIIFTIFLCAVFSANIFGQEQETQPIVLIPFGYDFIRLGSQSIHNPAIGVGFLLGDMDAPFTEVEGRILALALWRPLFFSQRPHAGVPTALHNVEALVDWRIERHQLLLILNSTADRPLAGGLSTFQAGAGWGYEVIRQRHISLILGAALAVGEFDVGDATLPVLPVPLIRFAVDTQWFNASFDFLTGPNLDFTIAPEKRIRFTADMRMDHYRSIIDVICEFTLWYRLFPSEHRLGDFAGIGIGFKNDAEDFAITGNQTIENRASVFEIQRASLFAVIDLSLLRLEGGWIFNSRYTFNGQNAGSPGRGFYLSVQGIIPIGRF
ncbi:MAG: hypothetical protein FWG66_03560 [Spirochaetes bacterium]|nr:hypothetical protein [Spirochaetota bacterium]